MTHEAYDVFFCAAILSVATGTSGKILQPLVERVRHHLTTVMRAEGVQQCTYEGPCVTLFGPQRVHQCAFGQEG
jgi:hypothetical protein